MLTLVELFLNFHKQIDTYGVLYQLIENVQRDKTVSACTVFYFNAVKENKFNVGY